MQADGIMKFTEEELARQNEQVTRLSQELSRLNELFDAQKKAMGVTDADLEKGLGDVPPAVAAAMEEAKLRAERAGREAAASLRAATEPEASRPASRGRRGALRI